MSKALELKGLDELLKDYDKVREEGDREIAGSMERGLLLLEGFVKNYPPQPPRDRAKTFNTYVRGIGRYPKSAFVAGRYDAKAFRALKKSGAKVGKVRMTSQRLGSKWTHKVEVEPAQIVGFLGNSSTYANWVQGDSQTDFHKETGWPTVDDSIESQEDIVLEDFESTVNLLLTILSNRR